MLATLIRDLSVSFIFEPGVHRGNNPQISFINININIILGSIANIGPTAEGENGSPTKIQVVADKSGEKAKEELERTQQKMAQEKHHFQAEQRELEGKLKAKTTELEAKETELGEEIAKRKKITGNSTAIEKQKIDLEVEIAESRRKLERMQESKQVDDTRITDLEVGSILLENYSYYSKNNCPFFTLGGIANSAYHNHGKQCPAKHGI